MSHVVNKKNAEQIQLLFIKLWQLFVQSLYILFI